MRKVEQSIERRLPEGMRFYLPDQAEMIAGLADKGKEILKNWGYRPIFVPALLPYDTVLKSLGEESVKEYYKLIDYRGEILVLRPEMTAAIAERLVAEEGNHDFPGRYHYFAPVYRHETTQSGKKREIYQLGAEFLGDSSHADVEILMLAQKILFECGIKNFEVEIGHIGFLNQLLQELNMASSKEKELKSHLARRDLVSYRNLCETFSADIREKLLELLKLRGDKNIISRAYSLLDSQKCSALQQLQIIYEGLADLNMEDKISFELGLTRNLDYYSGLVFEIMSPVLGYNICGGGRYDRLLQKLGGNSISGRGFAMGIERLRLIKEKQQSRKFSADKRALIRYQRGEDWRDSVAIAERLQELNITTELDKVASFDGNSVSWNQDLILDVRKNENGENRYSLRKRAVKSSSDHQDKNYQTVLKREELTQAEVIKIAEKFIEDSSA